MTIDINMFELESVDLWENSKSLHIITAIFTVENHFEVLLDHS